MKKLQAYANIIPVLAKVILIIELEGRYLHYRRNKKN
jgi:hypothetical protein